ncbi:hypothetical protein K504DRAFT_498936 [Pleomassaria siparia CBS 279.74]|uniref:DUF6594 domain-containing protein n=1 Tax=Pleomassaria siparia CBS 279.74 TaxID=1314801 RepID=A0A6G1KPB0_9PLEO|nr:hypothetical protein K504DRAFT_498936 [Pleomassaria siparia CBS 279.74]
MTGDTMVMGDMKLPTSPTDTQSSCETLRGDAIIEIADEDCSTTRPSVDSRLSEIQGGDDAAQPKEKRPTVLRRITGSFKSTPDPLSVTEINTRTLENTPNGFPRLAAFQASEANFGLYRSFSYLHSRILLDLQDEITCLEKELDELDWDDSSENPNRLRSREADVAEAENEPGQRNRRVLLGEIRIKLMEYDQVLIKARELEAFQKPSDRNYRSVRRYHHNTKPLMDAEMDSIRSQEDTVSLRSGREWASFDGGVETLIGQLDRGLKWVLRTEQPPLQRFFRTPALRAKTTNAYIALYSSSRIDQLINVLITFVIFILLVIPVITMYHLTSTSTFTSTSNTDSTSPFQNNGSANSANTINAVGVLIVFTLLFSAAMSILTKAARHELFAASAAYCAILVVFIGNFTGPGN